jgi:hypothetical protein
MSLDNKLFYIQRPGNVIVGKILPVFPMVVLHDSEESHSLFDLQDKKNFNKRYFLNS